MKSKIKSPEQWMDEVLNALDEKQLILLMAMVSQKLAQNILDKHHKDTKDNV